MLPVPPGFAITTETCREFLADGWPDGLEDEIRTAMAAVEQAVGRRFGDPSDPLLVSVRSGAPVSMPGMMDTILDLGLNDDDDARSRRRWPGTTAFAEECRRRFVESFRSIVGVEDVPEDPWAQLRLAIEAVFRSWQSDRARTYRQKEGIPDDLGTAVTVQAMVFGNRGSDSGTGVLFTRNPATGEPTLYGDVLFDAQGEDVVAGTHQTEPIAVLDTRLPAVARELRAAAERLEHHYADLCDIEFTIEDGKLWLLQVRVGKRSAAGGAADRGRHGRGPGLPADAGAGRSTRAAACSPIRRGVATGHASDAVPLTTGLAASPGVASGPIVTDPDAAVASAEAGHAGHPRPRRDVARRRPRDGRARPGILTSRGGLASHAAVVARGLGHPCRRRRWRRRGRRRRDPDRRAGARGRATSITIDGGTGEVFEGAVAGATEVAPGGRHAARVGARGRHRDRRRSPPRDGRRHGFIGRPDRRPTACLRAIAIKGFALADGVADAVLATPEDVRPGPRCTRRRRPGRVDAPARTSSPTRADLVPTSCWPRSARRWGVENAAAALDAFLEIDHRVKEVVTAWQMRDPQTSTTTPTPTTTLVSSSGWRRSTPRRRPGSPRSSRRCPRLARLRRAARPGARCGTKSGDGRFVASPRVDSYHGIWFELHEDLIQLAGRTREEETAAGRA